jgi:hypothetical protein
VSFPRLSLKDFIKLISEANYQQKLTAMGKKSMLAVLHSNINSLKSGIFHLTGQSYCKKARSAKVKDGIRN